jgi:hypothetical protein
LIQYYFSFRGNASRASREVYGGTARSSMVKGWRKKKKFTAILREIIDREFYLMDGGIACYLYYLNTKAEKHKTLMREVGGTRGLLRSLKRW